VTRGTATEFASLRQGQEGATKQGGRSCLRTSPVRCIGRRSSNFDYFILRGGACIETRALSRAGASGG
jgi:hypothetical protein